MQGSAFKCDNIECGRVSFMPIGGEPTLIAPFGWVGVTEAQIPGEAWPDPLHFCSWECLFCFAERKINGPEDQTLAGAGEAGGEETRWDGQLRIGQRPLAEG